MTKSNAFSIFIWVGRLLALYLQWTTITRISFVFLPPYSAATVGMVIFKESIRWSDSLLAIRKVCYHSAWKVPAFLLFNADAGIKTRYNFRDYRIVITISYIIMGVTVQTMKNAVDIWRPDGSNNNSFPSEHIATAFVELIYYYLIPDTLRNNDCFLLWFVNYK